MRWHEMAIDQAELEHKVNNFKKDASKVEELFEEIMNFDKKTKGYGLWPLPWVYEKLKKRWTKSSLKEILKVLSFNEEIYHSIAVTQLKLNRNKEAITEYDKKAELSLRQSIFNCQIILSEVEARFAKFDGVFKSLANIREEGSSAEIEDNRPKRRFFKLCF